MLSENVDNVLEIFLVLFLKGTLSHKAHVILTTNKNINTVN